MTGSSSPRARAGCAGTAAADQGPEQDEADDGGQRVGDDEDGELHEPAGGRGRSRPGGATDAVVMARATPSATRPHGLVAEHRAAVADAEGQAPVRRRVADRGDPGPEPRAVTVSGAAGRRPVARAGRAGRGLEPGAARRRAGVGARAGAGEVCRGRRRRCRRDRRERPACHRRPARRGRPGRARSARARSLAGRRRTSPWLRRRRHPPRRRGRGRRSRRRRRPPRRRRGFGDGTPGGDPRSGWERGSCPCPECPGGSLSVPLRVSRPARQPGSRGRRSADAGVPDPGSAQRGACPGHGEAGAAGGRRPHAPAAAGRAHDRVADREAEARAAGLRRRSSPSGGSGRRSRSRSSSGMPGPGVVHRDDRARRPRRRP